MSQPDDMRGRSGRRYGQAGTSLHSQNSGGKKYARTARVGAAGERRFSDFVQADSELSAYYVYESLKIPAGMGQKRYSSDVDFALASDNKVILVDVKAWKANKFYWSAFGKIFAGFDVTNNKMSRNMALAQARYQEALPQSRIEAITIFVRTKNGLPSSVKFLRFPGGVKSYLPPEGARRIKKFLGEPQRPDEATEGLLGRMTRNKL